MKEALHNVIDHSGAQSVSITIALRKRSIELKIADDGHGLNMSTLEADPNYLGQLRSRAKYMKGHLDIQARPGGGTSLLLHAEYQ